MQIANGDIGIASSPNQDSLENPPGLVGEIADYIMAQAAYPSRRLPLAVLLPLLPVSVDAHTTSTARG